MVSVGFFWVIVVDTGSLHVVQSDFVELAVILLAAESSYRERKSIGKGKLNQEF